MTSKLLVDFTKALGENAEVKALKEEVQTFARSFPMPGWDIKTMRYT
jgi:glycine hydroxymethyltransferase